MNWGSFWLGVLAAHLFWALVCVLMWWKLVRKLPPDDRREATQQDFQAVRDVLQRHAYERRN